MLGIIGGSGLRGIAGLKGAEERVVTTRFGEPSGPYLIGEIAGQTVAFLSRHGTPHRIPPHKINYRANISGFKSLGAERLLSVSAAGGINRALRPGDIVLLEQVIDLTQGARASTFYEGDEVVHVDFTEPYCPELRQCLFRAGEITGIPLSTGTYICVQGPRLETRAEIELFARAGADVVGMTGMPEAALARELELCMQAVVVVTNYAAGISQDRLTTAEVVGKMKDSEARVAALLEKALPLIPKDRACPCKDALRDAKF